MRILGLFGLDCFGWTLRRSPFLPLNLLCHVFGRSNQLPQSISKFLVSFIICSMLNTDSLFFELIAAPFVFADSLLRAMLDADLADNNVSAQVLFFPPC